VKFLVDNQLPRELSQFFCNRGLDCEHVLDVGLAGASDLEICRYARANGRIIVSKDEDFFYIATKMNNPITLIWVRLGNCRTSVLLASFEQLWAQIEKSLASGNSIIEIR
jgi:predicted nuclease of predicted toxin-antitoxin system